MTTLTALCRTAALFTLSTLVSIALTSADEQANAMFSTTVKASSEHPQAADACRLAMNQAESEALLQAEEHFSQPFSLAIEATEQQERAGLDGQTICEFTGTWQGHRLSDVSVLVGQETSVDARLVASCPDNRHSDLCWSDIVGQAAEQLRIKLTANYDDIGDLTFRYLEFEGWQRDRYRDRHLEVTADGTFYFEIAASRDYDASIRLDRHWDPIEPAPRPKPAPTSDKPAETESPEPSKSEPDDLDMTLFYVWDGNDRAGDDVLAISSERWGAGLWANNRVGFSLFKGSDRLGIGDDDDNVKNTRQRYDTFGVGMGYRLWANRSVTLENMLYYVDAQPFQGTIAPDCDSCTARTFRSDNYPQATVNLKTNTHGLNVGWMFTWKFLETDSTLDKLSSGFYLEVQF